MPRPPSLRARLLPRVAALARGAPVPLLLAARPQIAWTLRAVPGWRARVQRAMRAGLGEEAATPAQVDAYFRHLADLLVFSLAVNRSGIHGCGLERFWVPLPGSRARYAEALAAGKGALMVCPHLILHEIMAGSATAELPITVLVRRSPDAEYEAFKQQWYAALGVRVVHRPQKGSALEGLGEMTAALRVLRKNGVLAITPDLVRKRGTGVPVRLFGRRVELPAGAFFLAVRTGTPLLPSFFHEEAGVYRLWTHPPLRPDPALERDTAIAALAQDWTDQFEAFLREHPDMWQFWLDKRWYAWLTQPARSPL